MKKLILLFTVATFTLTSCSSDDNTSSDPLIGTWTWHKSFVNGVEENLGNCDKMDTVIISSNGTLSESYFWDNNGTCESDGTDMGTWENIGKSVYRIVYDAGTPDEEVIEQKINFDGNTFYIEEVDGQYTYKVVYIKN